MDYLEIYIPRHWPRYCRAQCNWMGISNRIRNGVSTSLLSLATTVFSSVWLFSLVHYRLGIGWCKSVPSSVLFSPGTHDFCLHAMFSLVHYLVGLVCLHYCLIVVLFFLFITAQWFSSVLIWQPRLITHHTAFPRVIPRLTLFSLALYTFRLVSPTYRLYPGCCTAHRFGLLHTSLPHTTVYQSRHLFSSVSVICWH